MPFRLLTTITATLLALIAAAASATAGEFVDAAGRRVILPERVDRILPAERNAEVLIFVVAPNKLVGLSRVPGRAGLLPGASRLPTLGWRPRTDPASMAETVRRLHPDLIIDAGTVTEDRAAFADQVQAQTGVPYILLDDTFARMPTMLRGIAATLGDPDRGVDLAIWAEHAIAGLRGQLLIRPANSRPRVYYALGVDGLTTALPGSPAGEAIDAAGAINVAHSLGRGGEVAVSPGQLIAWNPDIIIAEERRAYDGFRRSPAWRGLAAVRSKHIYLEPTDPFGWIEDPSGINRLVGLHWLASVFYPDATQEDLRVTVCDFYEKFYEIKLTNKQLEAMLGPAGAPPLEAPRLPAEPLVGLGAAPPSSLSPGTEGVAPGAPSTTSAAPPAAEQPDICVVPHGPSPQPVSGTEPSALTPGNLPSPATPGTTPATPTPAVPGVPPPGRRGRPSATLDPPPNSGSSPYALAPGIDAEQAVHDGPAYQYQTRP